MRIAVNRLQFTMQLLVAAATDSTNYWLTVDGSAPKASSLLRYRFKVAG